MCAQASLPAPPLGLHVGGWVADVVGAFTPWKLGSATNQGLNCFVDCLDLRK